MVAVSGNDAVVVSVTKRVIIVVVKNNGNEMTVVLRSDHTS